MVGVVECALHGLVEVWLVMGRGGREGLVHSWGIRIAWIGELVECRFSLIVCGCKVVPTIDAVSADKEEHHHTNSDSKCRPSPRAIHVDPLEFSIGIMAAILQRKR